MKEETTIGILYPGDMGVAVAEILLKNNFQIITASEGRSSKTLENIRRAKLKDVLSLQNVVNESDVILSINSPSKSVEIAAEVSRLMKQENLKKVFVDLNSNTPESSVGIYNLFASTNSIFINGAILGASKDIENNAVIIFSGEHRKYIMQLFDGIFNTKDVGEKIESASAYKLLFSLVNKGINAVFFETMIAASHYGIIDELNDSLEKYLPGTYQDLSKTTPTYIDHIERRTHEMEGLVEMQQNNELPSNISSAAAKTFEIVNDSNIFNRAESSNVFEIFQLFKKLQVK